MPSSPANTNQRPRWRRAGRLAGIAAALLVLAVALLCSILLLLARSSWGLERLRRLALDQARPALPGLSIERLEGNLTGWISLQGLVLNDRHGRRAIAAERVSLRYRLLPLMQKRVQIESLVITAPSVFIELGPSGELNLANLLGSLPEEEAPTEESPPDWRIILSEVLIKGGRVERPGETPLTLREIELKGEVAASAEGLTLALDSLALEPTLPLEGIGALRLAGRASLTPDGIQAGFKLRVRDGTPHRRITTLQLKAGGKWSRTTLSLGLRPQDGGALDLTGWVDLAHGDDLAYDLTARLEHLNPHALLPLLPAGDLNLELKTSGRGIPLQPGCTLSGRLLASRSELQGARVDHVQLSARLKGTRWTLPGLEVRASGAHANVAGSGTLEQFKARAKLKIPRIDRLPLPGSTPKISGSIALEASVSGPVAGPYSLRAEVRGAELEMSGVRVARLTLQGALAGLPTAPRGQLQLQGATIQVGGDLTVDKLSVLLHGDGESLSLETRAHGKDLDAAAAAVLRPHPDRIDADLNALRLRLRGRSIRLIEPLRIRAAKSGDLTLSALRLAALGGNVAVGAFNTRDLLTGHEPHIRVTNLRLLEGLTLSGVLSAHVQDQQLRGALRARFSPGRGQLALDAQIPLPRGDRTTLAQLLRGKGGQLTLEAEHLPLSSLASLGGALSTVQGEVDLSARLEGSLKAPSGAMKLRLREGSLVGLDQLDLRGELQLGARQIASQISLTRAGRRLLILTTGLELETGKLVATPARWPQLLRSAPIQIDATLSLDDLTRLPPFLHQGALGGGITARLKGSGSVDQAAIHLELTTNQLLVQGHPLGDLAAALVLQLAPARISAELKVNERASLLVLSRANVEQGLWQVISGGHTRALPLSASLGLPGISLARLNQLGLLEDPISGVIKGALQLSGTLGAPAGKLNLELRDARLRGHPLGQATASATISGDRLAGDLKFSQHQGGEFTAAVEYALSSDQLRLKTKGRRLKLDLAAPLVPMIKEAGGELNLDLEGAGTSALPALSGSISLSGGRLRLAGAPLVSNLVLSARLTPQRIELKDLSAEISSGRINASGALELDRLRPGAFSLDLRASQLQPRVGLLKGITFDSPIRLRGTISPEKLAAQVRLERGSLLLPDLQNLPSLHGMGLPADVVFVEQDPAPDPAPGAPPRTAAGKPGPAASKPGPLVDLSLQTAPLAIRSKQIEMDVHTDLRVLTDQQGQTRLSGGIQVKGGWIEMMKNRYVIRHARVTFNGSLDPNPALNLRLARRINSETVFIEVTGTARQPHIALRSAPAAYSQAQLLSMILTGRVDRDSDSEGDPKLAIFSAISQAVIGNLAQELIPAALIDTAKIGLDDKNKNDDEFVQRGQSIRAKAEVGRHLTENIYIGYRRIIGAATNENTNEGLFEYSISNSWFLDAVFGDAGAGGIDLIWTYSY